MAVLPQEASVLIVEDNVDNLFMLEILLREDVGVRYYNARGSGWQFFKLIDANPGLAPDLILLDLQLPYEDGFGVLKKIRSTPRLSGAKVVAVTSNTEPQEVERARRAGFDGFIGKPISRHRFPEQIRRLLNSESVWEPS